MGSADWKQHKEHKQQKRADNRVHSTALLRENGIDFTEHNDGAHLIVQGPQGLWDFWPGTGRWSDRKARMGFGVQRLLRLLKQEETT